MKLHVKLPIYFREWVWQKAIRSYPHGYHFDKYEIEHFMWLAYRKGRKAGQDGIIGDVP